MHEKLYTCFLSLDKDHLKWKEAIAVDKLQWANHGIDAYDPEKSFAKSIGVVDVFNANFLYNEKYIRIANDSLLADANQLRAKVGLSSVQEQLLKIRFREKFPQSPYMLPVTRGIINLSGFPEEVLKKILEKGQKY